MKLQRRRQLHSSVPKSTAYVQGMDRGGGLKGTGSREQLYGQHEGIQTFAVGVVATPGVSLSLSLSGARGLWLVKFYAFFAPVCCKMKIVTPRRSRSLSRSRSSQRSIQDESSGNDDKDDDVACQTWHPLRGCCGCGCCFVFGFYDFGGIYFT